MFNKLFFILFLIFSVFSFSQSLLQSKIDSILSATDGLKQISIKIIDADSNKVIYEKNPETLLSPASTMKLFTTATALLTLGKEHNLGFYLCSNAEIENGKLLGDLILKSKANPFIADSTLDSLANIVKERNISQINGDIFCDDSYFDNDFNLQFYKEEQKEVQTPIISPVIINGNEITIEFIPTYSAEKYFEFNFLPQSGFYETNFNAILTRRFSLPKMKIISKPFKIEVNIYGKIKRFKNKISRKIFIDNPALFTANIFYEKLKKLGIKIKGKPNYGKYLGKLKSVFAMVNEPLENVIEKTNKESNNFLAEIILNITGAEYCKSPGSRNGGIKAIENFLKKNEIDISNCIFYDGSGISLKNKVTAECVVDLLKLLYDDNENFNTFYNSLSAAGIDGTLEQRLVGFGLKNNFHGKTGTLKGVSAISGYFTTLKDKNVIVSIIMNFNKKGAEYWREIQDEIITEITTDY